YDLFLTFNSIKKFLNDDLDLGEKLFMHYWKAYPNAELIPYLQKVLRWLSPLMAIGRLLGRINKHNNDINTSIFFGQILKTSLPNLKPHQTPSYAPPQPPPHPPTQNPPPHTPHPPPHTTHHPNNPDSGTPTHQRTLNTYPYL